MRDDLRHAGGWLARLGTSHGHASEQDRVAFRAWYHARAEHRRAFAAVAATEAVIAQLSHEPALVALEQAALARVAARRRRPRWMIGVLGASAIMVPVAALTIRHWDRLAAVEPAPSIRVVTTAVGERRLVALDGHAQVMLDTNSRLTIAGQTIRVDGQAYVTAGTRPARVQLPGGMIVSSGGALNVRGGAADASVLAEGSAATVRQSGEAEAAALVPGDVLSIARGGMRIARAADPAAITGWRSGWLFFDDAPLSEAAEEVNRYRRTPIRLLRGSGALRISGSFRTDDTGAFLRAVAETLPATVDVGPDGATITPANGRRK